MPRWRVWNNSVFMVMPSFSASHGLPSQLTSARSYQPPIQMSLSWMTRITWPVTWSDSSLASHATTGELLGAHMIGAEVTELIQGYVIAKSGELTDQELAHTIFPHPTLSEMMHEAVLAADGAAMHI